MYGMNNEVAELLAFVPAIVGLVWALKELYSLKAIKIDGQCGTALSSPLNPLSSSTLKIMTDIAGYIQEGSTAFLVKEYTRCNVLWIEFSFLDNSFLLSRYQYMAVYMIVFSCILWPWVGPPTAIAFIVGYACF